MSITSSKISFWTQFKRHIVANREAHQILKKFGNPINTLVQSSELETKDWKNAIRYLLSVTVTGSVSCFLFLNETTQGEHAVVDESATQRRMLNHSRHHDTVRDNLFRMCRNFGQHPPFFSQMRIFFRNRAPIRGTILTAIARGPTEADF